MQQPHLVAPKPPFFLQRKKGDLGAQPSKKFFKIMPFTIAINGTLAFLAIQWYYNGDETLVNFIGIHFVIYHR